VRYPLSSESALFAFRPVSFELGVGHGMSITAIRRLAHKTVAPKLLRSKRVPLSLGVLGVQLLLRVAVSDHGNDDLGDTDAVGLAADPPVKSQRVVYETPVAAMLAINLSES
jgi:hypothetical protein